MKLFRTGLAALICGLLFSVSNSFALVIDTDTVIAPNDTNYESLDLVVTNCTLTVDGPHTFANLQLLSGGVLTHSGSGSSTITNLISVTNEFHVLTDAYGIVPTYHGFLSNTIVITDLSGVTNYAYGSDYTVSNALIVRLPASAIMDGASVLVSYQAATLTNAGLFLTISNNFEIEAGGKVDLTGKGYGPGLGSGAGKLISGVGSGGGHGGYGGTGSGVAGGAPYGSTDQPATLGSGGSSSGGSGGGAAKISVGILARIDGIISVNGTKATNSQMGGGAGGSLWLTTPMLTGAGSISANGGSGEVYLGGGGSGGRIAIYADTNLFAGDALARGGPGWIYGAAGTIYLKGDTNSVAQVIIDNRGAAGTNTLLSLTGSYDLTVRGKAFVVASGLYMRNLTVRSNSWLMPLGAQQALTLTVTGDVLIETNGGLNFDLKGYPGGSGPGTPSFSGIGQGGGGHGGQGGSGLGGYFGTTSGSDSSPATFGSGGGGSSTGGGAGGGAVTVNVLGTLSLFGQITANGGDALAAVGGGGAGGSIYLGAGTLVGNGKITANGGNGDLPAGGGGGGGRIAIYYGTNFFSGRITAFGGYGFVFGGAGTIINKINASAYTPLLIDNGGAYGSYTPLSLSSSTYDVTIVGGAAMTNSSATPAMNSLYVGSNSIYFPGPSLLTVGQNVTVEDTGAIDADGDGSLAGGTGYGKTSNSYGSGGGYGGIGGAAISPVSGPILGGNSYGSITAPIDLGSGGGAGSGQTSYNYGGAGGGIVRMTVNGTLRVNGRISANGLTGIGGNSGGGSGGTINITAWIIQGTGTISANGGIGESLQGGGGGGGRIAINYTSNYFAGVMTAQGGAGKSYGGAGTIFRRAAASNYGQLIVDNGGNVGGVTPSTLTDSDMVVSGGAIFTNTSSSTGSLRSLFVGSNSVYLTAGGSSGNNLSVAGNVTISLGGKFSMDGLSTSSLGAGAALSSTGGGGANCGNGGASSLGAAGGASFYTVGYPGGVGGWSTTTGTGGAGGGGITLTVSGNLLVDGKLSANGNSAVVSGAGGGAGGSIVLSLGTLSGSGIISANGGAGDPPAGGGGGGGRVTITYGTNTFTGQMTAYGGAGANYGGAGAVSLKQNASSTSQWIVDNGGFVGALTPLLPTPTLAQALVVKGGAILSNGGSALNCSSLYIGSNSWFVPNFGNSTSYYLNVTNNVVIEEGGGITADGKGYTNSSGVTVMGGSVSSVGAGGGNGGVGGSSFTGALGGTSAGSVTTPASWGGVGGFGTNGIYGGAGGGSITLTVTGSLTNNGKITANGMSGAAASSGGGAGGSISLTVGTLAGKGSISANGGAGENSQTGGGGGGRVYLSYGANTLTGRITACGGAGWMNGGAGTIYLKPNIGSPLLLLDNAGMPGAATLLNAGTGFQGDVTVAGGSTLSFPNSTMQYLANVVIKSNSVVTSSATNFATLNLTINGNMTIEAGGRLYVDGQGERFVSGTSSARGTSGSAIYGPSGGGGGHAGFGGASINGAAGGTPLFDTVSAPTGYGGAGGSYLGYGGNGGGAIRLILNGNLTVDGLLSANGLSGTNGCGGGAGGSVYVTVQGGDLFGSGSIQANAGNGDMPASGGGSGGRIALASRSNLFTGSVTAFGGTGANNGGAGTISVLTNSNPIPGLVLDNNGNRGAYTPISSMAGTKVSILDGAVATVSGSVTFYSLLINSNSWLSYSNLFPTITVTKDTVIEKGGGILLAGASASGTSLGIGASSPIGSGGGGHGGYGGSGNGAIGGLSHDSIFYPVNEGGTGGTPMGTTTLGGGAFRFITTQTLVLDGDIIVNGANATNSASGGGAGGSVWINAGTLAGKGSIQANGGSGTLPLSGGGAGGMIAVYYDTSTFTGSMSAHGARGFNGGGAGTIYSRNNSDAVGTLLVDNAGIIGTNTPLLLLTEAVHLVVQGRASVTKTNPQQILTSLVVGADGAIVQDALATNLDLLVLQDALINGVINADRAGLSFGTGIGQYGFAGSGGGYGGNGGDSSSSTGGTNYGSEQFPVDPGSGGGAIPYDSARTVGGGVIRLQVGGALTVNGNVSANGGDGLLNNTGGGSGGSIWVTASSLVGNGSISANGGAGEPSEAGGGGGGRVAIYTHSNNFAGAYSVAGGQGWMNGGVGTLFLGTSFSGPHVVSMSVNGMVWQPVSSLQLQFDSIIDPNSVFNFFAFTIDTPNGLLYPTATMAGPSTILLSFPTQTAIGGYMVHCGPQVYDMFGVPMSAPYGSGFSIMPLVISGTVTDTNNVRLSGISVQPSGLSAVTTDSNGVYTVSVPPSWTGTITPDTNSMFLPASRSYTNVLANTYFQGFTIVTPEILKMSTTSTSTQLTLGIFGVSQVKYQVYGSDNLIDWISYSSVIMGGNSNLSFTFPISSSKKFFQIRINN